MAAFGSEEITPLSNVASTATPVNLIGLLVGTKQHLMIRSYLVCTSSVQKRDASTVIIHRYSPTTSFITMDRHCMAHVRKILVTITCRASRRILARFERLRFGMSHLRGHGCIMEISRPYAMSSNCII